MTVQMGQLRSARGSAARDVLVYGVGSWGQSSELALHVSAAAEPEDGAGDGVVGLGKLLESFAGC